MMTSAGAVLLLESCVFANTMIINGSHPSYMDPARDWDRLEPPAQDLCSPLRNGPGRRGDFNAARRVRACSAMEAISSFRPVPA
jgi:hypothetical protein